MFLMLSFGEVVVSLVSSNQIFENRCVSYKILLRPWAANNYETSTQKSKIPTARYYAA